MRGRRFAKVLLGLVAVETGTHIGKPRLIFGNSSSQFDDIGIFGKTRKSVGLQALEGLFAQFGVLFLQAMLVGHDVETQFACFGDGFDLGRRNGGKVQGAFLDFVECRIGHKNLL